MSIRLIMLLVLLVPVLSGAMLAAGCTQDAPDPFFVGGESDGDGDADGDVDGDADGDGDGDGDACTGEDYPCGPYGDGACQVMENRSFISANSYAEDLDGGDGILSLEDLYQDDSIVGILLFGTAGWCSACRAEAEWLITAYDDFQNVDGRGGRIEVVAVVFEDDFANPADQAFATAYGERYGFMFPTVADPGGSVLYYFDAESTPGNILIDATEMRINRIIQGFDSNAISGILHTLDGSVTCR